MYNANVFVAALPRHREALISLLDALQRPSTAPLG